MTNANQNRNLNSRTSPSSTEVLSNKKIIIGSLSLLVVGAIIFILLLRFFTDPGSTPSRLEALKTAATLVFGTGGGVALWLTAKRQRSTELTIAETARIATENQVARELDYAQRDAVAEQDRKLREKSADDGRFDAEERRITDIYSKAAEQLGHDNAAVRLAGLYALQRVADSSSDQRRSIVNLICAYLRMPFDLTPTDLEQLYPDGITERRARIKNPEIEVRRTAQKILLDGTQTTDNDGPPKWTDTEVDLSGAALFDFEFIDSRLARASFDNAEFFGDTRFLGTHFGRGSGFRGAKFNGSVDFTGCTFRSADFREITCLQDFHLGYSTIDTRLRLEQSEFASTVSIDNCSVQRINAHFASFQDGLAVESVFSGTIDLSRALLAGEITFPDGGGYRLLVKNALLTPDAQRNPVLAKLTTAEKMTADGARSVIDTVEINVPKIEASDTEHTD